MFPIVYTCNCGLLYACINQFLYNQNVISVHILCNILSAVHKLHILVYVGIV